MSVGERTRDGLRAIGEIVGGLIGWVVLAPVVWLFPRKPNWIAVIGREDGKFLDNTKYFFIQASADRASGLRVVQVTEREDVLTWVRTAGREALRFPSPAALLFLARCGTVVVDSIEWTRHGRRFLLVGAKRIQLWHGVGFKRIELDKWRNEAPSRRWMALPAMRAIRWLRKRLNGRIVIYDAVVTTSAFYRDQVFRRALLARAYPVLGYPRNCFGEIEEATDLVWQNVDMARGRLDAWREQGRRVVLIAPTFRDTRATPMGLDDATMCDVDAFCATHGFELLFKFHPYERGAVGIRGKHLHVLKADSDVYPLLPSLSAMVTDYSSIYMDFLLLGRPVIFFVPDLQEYVARDRSIQFDFCSMTPGPKVATWKELKTALVTDQAQWHDERERLRKLAFDTEAAGASRRLMAFLEAHDRRPSRTGQP